MTNPRKKNTTLIHSTITFLIFLLDSILDAFKIIDIFGLGS